MTSMEVLTLAASLVAVVISGYALIFHRRLEHETSAQTLIHAQYELCRVLDLLRVEHPEISHMLALPTKNGSETWKNYHLFKSYVRRLLENCGPVTEGDRARLYLREHATALHVCDIYEQTLYQLRLAKRARDKNRLEVLKMLAQYYEVGLLRSPRLRFHWDHGASDMMEQSTRDRYDRHVRKAYPADLVDEKSPLEDSVDS